jgi:hypothetical protein
MGIVWTHVDKYQDTEIITSNLSLHPLKVFGRVKDVIDWQVLAVDEAMRQAEEQFEIDQAWRCKKVLRDAALVLLDQSALVGWREESTGMEEEKDRHIVHDKRIQESANTLACLTTLHYEMYDPGLEAHMSGLLEENSYEESKTRLKRLRQQRVLRPRIIFNCAVSCKTGHGLKELRHAMLKLLEDQRLFPHIGMKVPINYAMLERLAQEGRLQGS